MSSGPQKTISGLTQQDIQTINQLIHDVRNLRKNIPLRSEGDETYQSNEVYIARADGAIPGLTVGAGLSGVGSGSLPGVATCAIYQIDTTSGILVDTGLSLPVYNLATTPVTAVWIPIQKDKFGNWLAPIGATGAASTGISITSCDCFNCLTPSEIQVGTCAAAPDGAPTDYYITIGNWAQFPQLFPNGQIHLRHAQLPDECQSSSSSSTYTDDGCMWYGCIYTVFYSTSSSSSSSSSSGDYGIYQFQAKIFTDEDGYAAFKCIPVLLGGTDVIGGDRAFAESW